MSRFPAIILGVLLALAAAASFAIDWCNVAQGGAVDLRNRITGIRLLEAGIDPYHYKWHKGEPEGYCDPGDKPNRIVTSTSVTPALLLLHVPLAMLPYWTGEFTWLTCQWALLLGTGALCIFSSTTARTRWLIALAVVGFSFTYEWRLHAERSQCYVLLVFLFGCWLGATQDARRGSSFWAGCLAGFLIALRPTFALLVPFLAVHRRGQLAGVATGLGLGFGLPMLMLSTCWRDYFSATETFSYLYRNGIHTPFIAQTLPLKIEGMPIELINKCLILPEGVFSLHQILLQHGGEPFPAWPPILLVATAFLVWLWFARLQPWAQMLPGLAAWLFLADLCLPVYRGSYDDVLILNVIAAGLALKPRIPWAAWPCLAGIALGAVVYWRNLDHPWVVLPSALFTLGAVMSLGVWKRNASSHAKASEAKI